MIRATMQLDQPGIAEATISITMPVQDWQRVMKQLPNEWPSWRVSAIIGELVVKAQTHFTATQEYHE